MDPDTSNDSLITTWKQISNENVQCLNELLKTSHLTLCEKLHILTTVTHLKSLSTKFKEHQHQRNHHRVVSPMSLVIILESMIIRFSEMMPKQHSIAESKLASL
ncbi:hypothetical protein PV327_008774 [Microctonus hyperodae]|uniref:Uncharacterized protein n=1 Tax=Microctonus hyperodae TaxID=165561 RepID=A0AA39FSU2_MICHY|nr:hypothetical protein PV327_008774 [Microctonus hyperodae]